MLLLGRAEKGLHMAGAETHCEEGVEMKKRAGSRIEMCNGGDASRQGMGVDMQETIPTTLFSSLR